MQSDKLKLESGRVVFLSSTHLDKEAKYSTAGSYQNQGLPGGCTCREGILNADLRPNWGQPPTGSVTSLDITNISLSSVFTSLM